MCKEKSVHAVESDDDDEDLTEGYVYGITHSVYAMQHVKKKAVHANMIINNEPVKFQVDCRAPTNLLPSKYVLYSQSNKPGSLL